MLLDTRSVLTNHKSILNVPGWQFLPGTRLFGVYIAITVPLIVIVVEICLCRPCWRRWWHALPHLSEAKQPTGATSIEQGLKSS